MTESIFNHRRYGQLRRVFAILRIMQESGKPVSATDIWRQFQEVEGVLVSKRTIFRDMSFMDAAAVIESAGFETCHSHCIHQPQLWRPCVVLSEAEAGDS